ncbi:MAG: HigA family addiction module antidote protein [Candidatus Omnitrophica bacterium]|nr:HigA family addiction module antidote protein [Candidatus Omnitrophota bacterium]
MAINKDLKFKPNYAVAPGLTVSEMLEHLGMSQVQLAERSGRPLKTINNIIQGKQAITYETALQFEKVLGMSADFWNNLEKNYGEALARIEDTKNLESELNWLKQLPVEDIISNEWIRRMPTPVEQLQEVLSFFGVASPKELAVGYPEVIFRQSKKLKSNPWAVCAWLRKGEIDAQAVSCSAYDRTKFKGALSEIREMTTKNVPAIFEDWKKLCADSGVALVIVQELPNLRVNGATKWLRDKAVLQLSLFQKCVDILWFSFFHEAAHILLHGKKDMFIEYEKFKSDSDREQEADFFAEDFLVPRSDYEVFINKGAFNRSAILRFAADMGIAPGIVLGRLQHDKKVAFNQLHDLKPRLCWK